MELLWVHLWEMSTAKQWAIERAKTTGPSLAHLWETTMAGSTETQLQRGNRRCQKLCHQLVRQDSSGPSLQSVRLQEATYFHQYP